MLKSIQIRILLIIITLCSFGLRVWGLQHGLPFEYHPDEQQYILPGIGVVSGNFEPQAYYNPTLYPYLIGLVYTLTYLGLKLFNAFPDFFDLSVAWSHQMLPWTSGMIYLARYITAAMGVFTTLMVYHVGRKAYHPLTGLGAAIIFGMTFLPAREAHFAVSDTPIMLFIALTLYFCLRIVQRGHWTDYLWAGIAFGLSTATKYSGGLLILLLTLAHFLSHRYETWSKRVTSGWLLIMAGVVGALTYLLISPYTLLRWSEFWNHFSENLGSARYGFSGLELDPTRNGALFYLKSLTWGMGWPVLLLSLGAVLFALGRHRRADLLLLSFPLLVFFYMQRQEMYFVRWLTPLIPPMAVLAAEAVRAGVQWFSQKRPLIKWPVGTATLAVVMLLVLPSTTTAIKANQIFSRPDTRSEALAWVQQQVPPDSNVAAKLLSPPWAPPLAMPGLEIGPYNFAPVPDGGIGETAWEQYNQWQVSYVVATSFIYDQPLLDKSRQAARQNNMQILDQRAELVAVFNPYDRDYTGFFYHDQVYGPANDVWYRAQPGPVIKIYRLP